MWWVFILLSLISLGDAGDMHRRRNIKPTTKINEEELTSEYWKNQAQSFLDMKYSTKINTNHAKNIIFFLGDGMSIPTLKAARIYYGQQILKAEKEEAPLYFEQFPYSGLSRTYCINTQVPDSACTATAYLCGVKANYDTAGVTGSVDLGNCTASLDEKNRIDSIARWFQLDGKKSGLVTTARVTHATPSAIYAHTAHRNWECDVPEYIEETEPMPEDCQDIAVQLIQSETGKNLNVIMGGGRQMFFPETETGPEDDAGKRKDGKNLINEWLEQKEKDGFNETSKYIWNKSELKSLPDDTDYVLGLFESSHCAYHLDANDEDPSLEEMTEAAINILKKDDKGFFLLVEGGRIDHAHHNNLARKALDETVEFAKAIQKAKEITDEEDTLIVVTADHAHVFTVNGYPSRGNNIFGIADTADDNKGYTTLSYANGPGYRGYGEDGRPEYTEEELSGKDAHFPAMVPLDSETHGGDDVAIFATGPWAHLFTGSVEQNYIPHAMAFAACVGDGDTMCLRGSGSHHSALSLSIYALLTILYYLYCK
ncbi:alkaline phosphatase-like [Onthophagus taurus]|uniref:alkaline phosphatase-like n=1 Tax=Onthophagus taurus TaxID=166361 RepID=UPI0039BEC19F